VDPRTGLDDVEKRKFLTLPEIELRSLSRPACRKSLYPLRYPGSKLLLDKLNKYYLPSKGSTYDSDSQTS
jgi:hypothetical protein